MLRLNRKAWRHSSFEEESRETDPAEDQGARSCFPSHFMCSLKDVEAKSAACCLLQGEDHICCSALSPCGGWLAYSTVSSVRLYRVQYNNISMAKVSSPLLTLHSLAATALAHSSLLFFPPGVQTPEGAVLGPPALLLLRLLQTLRLL